MPRFHCPVPLTCGDVGFEGDAARGYECSADLSRTVTLATPSTFQDDELLALRLELSASVVGEVAMGPAFARFQLPDRTYYEATPAWCSSAVNFSAAGAVVHWYPQYDSAVIVS